MSGETSMATNNDDQSLSDNISPKQNKLGQSTNNNSQKLLEKSISMSSETSVATNNDDQSLSDNIPPKQNKLGQATNNNSQKLRDLKVVLFKLNVGERFPLPGKSGFSVEFPITAINFGKNRVPGVQKSTERRSKRILEAVVTCCFGCKNGGSCVKKVPKKVKSSSRQVKDATKKRKSVKRKKPGRKKKLPAQTVKSNHQSGIGLTVISLYGSNHYA